MRVVVVVSEFLRLGSKRRDTLRRNFARRPLSYGRTCVTHGLMSVLWCLVGSSLIRKCIF